MIASPDARRLWTGYALAVAGTLGLAACIAVLFLAMRGVLELGGFVASGGPYAIAHPAPSWIWMVPTSILSGAAFIGIQMAGARRLGGFTLLLPMWVVVFLALGGNFLDFGFRARGAGIAWIVCGVVFWMMAAMPLFEPLMARRNPALAGSWMAFPGGGARSTVYAVVHLVSAVAGAAAGVFFFTLLS